MMQFWSPEAVARAAKLDPNLYGFVRAAAEFIAGRLLRAPAGRRWMRADARCPSLDSATSRRLNPVAGDSGATCGGRPRTATPAKPVSERSIRPGLARKGQDRRSFGKW